MSRNYVTLVYLTVLAVGILAVASLGYVAYNDQILAKQPAGLVQQSQQTTSTVLVTSETTSTLQQTSTTLPATSTTLAKTSTTQVTRQAGPSVKVASLTVQKRVLGTRYDVVTLALELENDGGKGIVIVQYNQILSSSTYVVLEQSYSVPAGSRQVYTVTITASTYADYFTATIINQAPA